MTHCWIGRVFLRSGHGGNYTGVVRGETVAPAALAAALGFPDTAFIGEHAGREVTVRTYSPHEELATCLQTSLAVPVALGAGGGETWRVRHPAGPLEVRVEKGPAGLRCWVTDTGTDGEPEPVSDLPGWLRTARVSRLRQGRSRLYAQLPDITAVPASFGAADVLQACHAHACTAVVFYAPAGEAVRTRVFTTSLGGREDSATGGAAAGVGALLARDGRTGQVDVLQGPEDANRQGYLYLNLDGRMEVGGDVQPLLSGEALAC